MKGTPLALDTRIMERRLLMQSVFDRPRHVLSSLRAGIANVGLKIQSGPLERVCSLEANRAEHRAVLSFMGMSCGVYGSNCTSVRLCAAPPLYTSPVQNVPHRYRMYRAGTPVAFVGSDASKRTTQFGATEVNLRKDH